MPTCAHCYHDDAEFDSNRGPLCAGCAQMSEMVGMPGDWTGPRTPAPGRETCDWREPHRYVEHYCKRADDLVVVDEIRLCRPHLGAIVGEHGSVAAWRADLWEIDDALADL